jgi:ribokinase
MSRSRPRITVVGSINLDMVFQCARLPSPGETVLGNSMCYLYGGKGANQAVAAAKAGGQTSMIGRVGNDDYAEQLLNNLGLHHIDCSAVLRTSESCSGLAMITVDTSGQNCIVVIPGANAQLSVEDIERHRSTIEQSDVVLLQLEIPVETVLATIQLAGRAGVRVILDPAPVPTHPEDRLLQVDLICPNEYEAASITGLPVTSLDEVALAAENLRQRGAAQVAITLGCQGTYLLDDQGGRIVPAYPIRAVDTTAAGDAFAGALAVYWAETGNLESATQFANAAGALAATKLGAQQSVPDRQAIANRNVYRWL